MCYLNEKPIKHGVAVEVQAKSLDYLKKVLDLMSREPIAFEEYIPEVESLINELNEEDYRSNSKDWL